jgi:hypothetical protein
MSLALVPLLVKIAQGRQARPALHHQFRSCPHSQCLQPGHCERLGTDSAPNPCLNLGMTKRKHSITPARTTIASVDKEMQKPRLTASVRDGEREQAVLAVEQVSARSRRVRVSDRPKA